MTDHPPPPDTRTALIEAAIGLLQSGGLAGMTLRQAAARAGVSHAAPAHHFDGLPGLLTATAAHAFQIFTAHMTEARDAAPPEPRAQLLAVCEGYLAFAKGHAGLFQLMFTSAAVCHDDPALMAASHAAYGVLRAACTPFDAPDPKALETAVWALVHGYAALAPATAEIAQGEGRSASQFADLLWPLVQGMTATNPPPAKA